MPGTDVLVLAGGFGTRLRAAVADVPKPLASVAGRPFLSHQIENWVGQNVSSLTFLLYHEAGMIEAFLENERREGRADGCRLRSVTEPRPLGTGGAIAHAVRELEISGAFFVTNADTWLGSGIEAVRDVDVPAIAVVRVADASRYGSVRLENDRVTGFAEKENAAGSAWINAGLYRLDAAAFQDWNGEGYSLEQTLLPILANSGRLGGVRLQTEFIDIGVPQDYFRFCRWIESGKAGAL